MASRRLSPESVHGRQSEARRNDLAVLDAARDVFTARGADAPISDVAARAGVGIGTLYRRYGSKTELLQRLCVLAMEQSMAAATAALAADDAWSGLTLYVRTCVGVRTGALAALAGRVETTEEMRRTAGRGMRMVDEIVARARADGSLRPDVTTLDISFLIEQFSRRAPDPVDAKGVDAKGVDTKEVDTTEEANVRDRLLAIALDGLRGPALASPAADVLPGRPPSRRAYAARWSTRG
ncbi:MAG TPA: helix-turn-helix domain-containing protein [Micromonosporaceae bacterium]|nr:helix-turn-helix domain-containing protein [Micromonosporaceae bacterium]